MGHIGATIQYMIFEAFTFLFAFSMVIGLINAANTQVMYINKEVQEKSTITTNYEKEYQQSLQVSGKSVYSDIINLDESLNVYINNTLLNAEVTVNGKNFLNHIRYTDSTALAPYILFDHEYTKTVLVNTDGEVVGIRFAL